MKIIRTNGYITLISVLIAGAVVLLIVTTTLLVGATISKSSLTLENSNQAKALVDACAEEALQQIRDSVNYSGGDTVTFGNGSCTYNVINNGGQNRSIEAEGNVNSISRKVKIDLDNINPEINITYWQDVDNF